MKLFTVLKFWSSEPEWPPHPGHIERYGFYDEAGAMRVATEKSKPFWVDTSLPEDQEKTGYMSKPDYVIVHSININEDFPDVGFSNGDYSEECYPDADDGYPIETGGSPEKVVKILTEGLREHGCTVKVFFDGYEV